MNQILLQLLPKPSRSSYPQQEADDLDHQKKLPPPPTHAQATYDVPFLTRRYSTVCEAAGKACVFPVQSMHIKHFITHMDRSYIQESSQPLSFMSNVGVLATFYVSLRKSTMRQLLISRISGRAK